MRHAHQPSKTVRRAPAVLSIALILSFWACSTARNAEDAFNRGNYVAAAELWTRDAERGDLKALCACIAAVNLVHDAQKVQHLSARLEKLSAKLEHSGTKAVQDYEVLFSCLPTYYRRAAAGGNAHAQYALAGMYRGEKGKVDEVDRLVESAAKNGSLEAQWEMGVRHMFDDDKSTTVRWWKL